MPPPPPKDATQKISRFGTACTHARGRALAARPYARSCTPAAARPPLPHPRSCTPRTTAQAAPCQPCCAPWWRAWRFSRRHRRTRSQTACERSRQPPACSSRPRVSRPTPAAGDGARHRRAVPSLAAHARPSPRHRTALCSPHRESLRARRSRRAPNATYTLVFSHGNGEDLGMIRPYLLYLAANVQVRAHRGRPSGRVRDSTPSHFLASPRWRAPCVPMRERSTPSVTTTRGMGPCWRRISHGPCRASGARTTPSRPCCSGCRKSTTRRGRASFCARRIRRDARLCAFPADDPGPPPARGCARARTRSRAHTGADIASAAARRWNWPAALHSVRRRATPRARVAVASPTHAELTVWPARQVGRSRR